MKVLLLTDLDRGSYAILGQYYEQALRACGLDVAHLEMTVESTERNKVARALAAANPNAPCIAIHVTLGQGFRPLKGWFNIAIPLHEWSRYPDPWVPLMDAFDEIWACSRHIQEIMANSGVTAPIFHLPPPLETPAPALKTDYQPGKPFRFFFCGEPHFRKGHHLLIKGFQQAFPDSGEASLTIKTSSSCSWDSPREDIHIIRNRMERQALLNMYRDYDVFVSASLGEGFGLPLAEAILAGLPVAVNNWGGHRDILKPGAFYEIRHEVVYQPFCSIPEYYATDQQCAYSRPSSIAQVLRRIVDDARKEGAPEERRQQAASARAHLLERHGNAVAAAGIQAKLDKLRDYRETN